MPSHDSIRKALHSGSWYPKNKEELQKQMEKYLGNTSKTLNNVKALICPHAGYTYCGATAAWSWVNLDSSQIITIFLLGPSHHVYLSGCALPAKAVKTYDTPLGELPLDMQVISGLRATGKFQEFSITADEEEHSIEMQLPYLKHVMNGRSVKIVPIYVGDMSTAKQLEYGKLLLPYFETSSTVFVISSDFCHWGSRFHYTYINPLHRDLPIHESIEKLDFKGVDCIERHDLNGFLSYLQDTRNTICGRNPICLFLQTLQLSSGKEYVTKLLDYSQSQAIVNKFESSVSYAAFATSYKQ